MTTTPQLWFSLTDSERYERLLNAEVARDNALAIVRRALEGQARERQVLGDILQEPITPLPPITPTGLTTMWNDIASR